MGFRAGCRGGFAVLAGGFWPAARGGADVCGVVLEVWGPGGVLLEDLAPALGLGLARFSFGGWVLATTGRVTAGCFSGFLGLLPRDNWAMAGAKEGLGGWDLAND